MKKEGRHTWQKKKPNAVAASLYMIGQKDFIEAVERSICGRHLCDDVRAVAILIQHTLDSTDLPLYTAKSVDEILIFLL